MDRIKKRFDELEIVANEIAQSCTTETKWTPAREGFVGRTYIAPKEFIVERLHKWELFVQWTTSVHSLFERLFGVDSSIVKSFDKWYRDSSLKPVSRFKHMRSVFESAREQFENGYVFEFRNLVQAEVFETELEQAKYFLEGNWKIPSAVISGTVLESTLRSLCIREFGHEKKSAAAMNDDLVKAGVYTKATHAQLLGWIHIRNAAAHGVKKILDQVTTNDIARMIDGIKDFVDEFVI